MILTFRYRLLPTRRQHLALESILESQRQLYNAALEERVEAYRKAGITRTYFDQTKALTELRHSDPEFRAVPPNLQRATLKRLDDAYRSFFRRSHLGRKAGFPRFRGRGWFNTFGFREFSGIKLRDTRLRFEGLPGALRVHFHRALPLDADIRTCAFTRTPKGWRVSFAVRVQMPPIRRGESAVGVDLGINRFAVLSDGGFIPSIRAARRALRRQRRNQRAIARTKVGSGGRLKARKRYVRHHATVVRQRADHLHQASARLIRDYDVIVVENLNLFLLTRGARAHSVYDASWSKFISMLRYKAEKAGVRLIEVDPQETTQECSACGANVPKWLGDRVHDCPSCGLSIDRDLNAARNVLHRAGVGPGLRNEAGCGMRAGERLGSLPRLASASSTS